MPLAEMKAESTPKQTSVFENIVVAVDFSPISRRALQYALALAPEHDSRISVVHVRRTDWRYEMLESPPEIDLERLDADQQLHELIAEAGSKRRIESTLVKQASISGGILSVVEEVGADLLVLGTHGRRGLAKLALGSVSEELLRCAPCPVITVGPNLQTPHVPDLGLGTILFATDFGPGSKKALPLALKLAAAHGSKLVLLHMIPPMPATSTNLAAYAPATSAADELQGWETACRKRAVQELRACLSPDADLSHEPEYVVGTDFLPEGVLTAAAKFRADLIVMGATHSATPRVAAHIPWTAVHEIVANASCPVLAVAG